MPSEEDRAMTKGNMHKDFVKFSSAVFELCEQRDKQTDMLITIGLFHIPRGGGK